MLLLSGYCMLSNRRWAGLDGDQWVVDGVFVVVRGIVVIYVLTLWWVFGVEATDNEEG